LVARTDPGQLIHRLDDDGPSGECGFGGRRVAVIRLGTIFRIAKAGRRYKIIPCVH